MQKVQRKDNEIQIMGKAKEEVKQKDSRETIRIYIYEGMINNMKKAILLEEERKKK